MGGINQGGAAVGDVEVRIAGGFADDGEAGFFGGDMLFSVSCRRRQDCVSGGGR